MQTIHKYPLSTGGYSPIHLSKGYKILSAEMQHGNIQVWIMVNPVIQVNPEKVELRVVATGEQLEYGFADVHDFINTVIDGPLVWHIFQKVPHKNLRELSKAGT